MKTIWKVFGLSETSFLTGAALGSDGITEYDEMIVVRHHQRDFETEFDAMQFIQDSEDQFEHGFEIIKTYAPKK